MIIDSEENMGDMHDLPISSGKMVLMFFDDQASFLCTINFSFMEIGFGVS